jgi:hypothetical protein
MNDQASPTDIELFGRVENSPVGTFRLFIAEGVGTEENIGQHLNNIDVVSEKISNATTNKCFIEVISLRLQVIDFWLRIYFYNVPDNTEQREREFGRLIKQCFRLGLEKSIYDKLVTFNKHRVDAIHGFMIGTISYEKIEEVATEADELLRETTVYTLKNCGKVVSSRDQLAANPGAMTIHVSGFVQEIASGMRY